MREVKTDFDGFLRSYRDFFPLPDSAIPRYFSDILFRGHSSDTWELDTTLDRFGWAGCSIGSYAETLSLMAPEFMSFSGRSLPDSHLFAKHQTWLSVCKDEPLLKLAVELRHFGFPSPLLDWTRSPYIAAFFAYRTPTLSENVAIFAFMERAGTLKSGYSHSPKIRTLGPFIETTERHHIQQAEYTVCTHELEDHESFSKHEAAFTESRGRQDFLVKFLLPANERTKVLSELALMNLNAYTLFRNAEGLSEFLANKHLLSNRT